ncbi:putative nucleotidyltransferase substrate binding domain-containing protein [Stutzerimonas kirkiae]|uniref:Cyclic nucleotide-binding protein n=1 Tax=Stutzerimonas kirkiae TaxID=2211392 RepID=A0A4Q9QYR6_9GAMM|nr:putative nucleotidyltransferase substrate binding domain-containing protein [Stutzerimonas kirkiae]TBU89289.1 cyclic nucleotide-binding protein [Stutzerimonas kirkiae]TBU99669.1 cyclic nucleotide-binding protein [Stutzerimonas kirkiae]TBV12395.1 cyclic nucleotide-binding protein [Stutzerimonas kirkiae]TBV12594.1 cyclic nucleotide-binding protein [Stutzerimonas kirkiae]
MSKADAFTEAGKTAVLQNIHGTMEFLRKHPPFNLMENAHLAYLVENSLLRFYAAGESILKPDDGIVEHFYIVKQGRVHGQRPYTTKRGTEPTFEISEGECFPVAALVGERATRTEHLAAEDTFCLVLDKAAFVKLFSLSDTLRDFALRGVSSLLDQVNQQVQLRAAESLGAQYSLDTRLGDLALQHPVTCPPDATLKEAVRTMHEQHVGSIVIADEQAHPLGIFTLRDLRSFIGGDDGDLGKPIDQLMTPRPFHLPPAATAFDAAIAMTERHIAHVCVVDHGILRGVVSERDLFSLQRVDLVHLARTIRSAARVENLAALRSDIRQLVDNMLAHGASSTQITHIVTLLNDHTVCRVIELAIEELGDPGIPFTWLCFGSEGRREQTLHTDQDNGILFEAADAAEAAHIRGRLLPLAERINRDLDTCGFTLCRGNIMASNPQLCLSRQEWQRRFSSFVREVTAENLLSSTIFFDLRAIWGPQEGCDQLREAFQQDIASNGVFQRLMAENALRQRPPIGRFRDFVVTRKDDDDKGKLDLKVQGLTPFVDGARLLALSHAVESCNTLERLRQLVEKEVIDAKDGAAYEEAYHFIQQTRMQQHQQQSRDGQPYSNRLDPDALNHLDRRILRESFRQAQRLQASLALRYRL